jgi:predicted DNA-binding transcriptional regulator AlpA
MQNTPTTPDVEALLKAYFEAQPKAYSEAQPGAYNQYLRDLEGAHLFGISRTTFRKLVRQGQIPPPIKFGNCSRWERGALLDAAARLQRHGIVAGGSGNE